MSHKSILQLFQKHSNEEIQMNSHPTQQKLSRPRDPRNVNVVYDIFTDGSEIKDKNTYKTKGLGWSYVIFKDRNRISSECGSLHDFTVGTNQQAELVAIDQSLVALFEEIKPIDADVINIYTDSEYSIKCVTIWYVNWKTNNWKTAKNKPVKHRALIENIVYKLTQLKKDKICVRVLHVKAHTDRTDYISMGNQEADALARQCSIHSIRNKGLDS